LGTSIYFRTSTDVHLWSAVTTQWTVVPISPAAVITQFNAYITIEDGSTVTAYATRTGAVEALHLPAAPQVFHGQISSCWLSIAVLGSDAWAFGAFDGTWHHQQLSGATPNVLISQTAGVVSDGVSTYGVSAYDGDFVPAPVPGSAAFNANGDVAVAWTPSTAAGFSAHTNTWSAAALSNTAPIVVERGYVLFDEGNALVAYSAVTGTFKYQPIAPGFTYLSSRYVAAAVSGNDVFAYSSGQNRFKQRTFSSAPLVSISDEVLAVADSSGVTAFSVVTGAYSTTIPGTFNVQTNAAMVWVDDGTQGFAYCSVSGKWAQAPVTLGPSVLAVVLRNVVVIPDAQGYHAFSGRTGQWVTQTTTIPFQYSGPASGDVFVASDGLQTFLFDPVIVRWAPVQTAAPVTASDIWRQTYVGFDGSTAFGFGLMNNAWTSIPVQGSFQALDANSSCGFLLTDTHVYAYSAHGSLSTFSRYPEFSRLQPIGVPLRLIQAAEPGSRIVAYLSHRQDYLPLPPSGTIFIDRSLIFSRALLGIVPASGVLDAPLDLSGMRQLRGEAIHIQTIVFPPNGGARWIANSISPIVL
jgi:hypothetical protein